MSMLFFKMKELFLRVSYFAVDDPESFLQYVFGVAVPLLVIAVIFNWKFQTALKKKKRIIRQKERIIRKICPDQEKKPDSETIAPEPKKLDLAALAMQVMKEDISETS